MTSQSTNPVDTFWSTPVDDGRSREMGLTIHIDSIHTKGKSMPNRKSIVLVAACVLCIASIAVLAAPPLKLTGEFSYHTDEMSQEMIGDLVCFTPSSVGANQILEHLSMTGDDYGHDVWFCFSDTEQAKKALNIPAKAAQDSCGYGGKATVTVSGYDVYLEESEGSDMAKLESVSYVSPVATIDCEEEP